MQKKRLRKVYLEAPEVAMAGEWPGNIRDLDSALEFAFVIADGG